MPGFFPAVSRTVDPTSRRARRCVRLCLEYLEHRDLLSVSYAPAQVVHAYGFDQQTLTGSGQTIAIVDAYDNPNIASDLAAFDTKFGLPGTDTGTGATSVSSFFTKVNQNGSTSGLPAANAGWATEIALDVEWAHAIAPGANIRLVEANSASDSDLLAAVDNGAANAQVVSMSWGGSEFSTETSAAYEGHFTKSGVTFVASSGDYGAPPSWPAISTNVLAVGGTKLNLTSSNTWSSETGWGNGFWTPFFGGSGGGISKYELKPSYQSSVTQSSKYRTSPDVAYDADPNSGFKVLDSYGSGGWVTVGGTSAGSPQWAALIALADQSRGAPLTTTQTLSTIYSLPSSDFHDITSGNAGSYSAKAGYDLVTGRGSPIANLVIQGLASTTFSATVTPATKTSSSTGTSAPATGQHFASKLVKEDTSDEQTAAPVPASSTLAETAGSLARALTAPSAESTGTPVATSSHSPDGVRELDRFFSLAGVIDRTPALATLGQPESSSTSEVADALAGDLGSLSDALGTGEVPADAVA